MKEFIEKLIGRLENHMEYCKTCHEEFPNAKMSLTYEVQINAYKNVIEIVNELAEEYKNGWIPCSERLPEENLYVLCQGKNSIFIACIDSLDNKWRDNHYYTRTTIKAWMPLPEVYKG